METSKVVYNPWPLPKDESLQRIELQQLKDAGYEYNDPREIVTLFEKRVSEFAGSKYAVSVDCCTHAIELSLRYKLHTGELKEGDKLFCPYNTYISVPQTMVKLGFKIMWINDGWSGGYTFNGINDAAVFWEENMYTSGMLHCVSFQIKKPICIGRGGMVLTDDKEAADWIRLASYDGRDLSTLYDSDGHIKMIGYHYYMTPEDAARGILLMDKVKFRGASASWKNYPDVSRYFSKEHLKYTL